MMRLPFASLRSRVFAAMATVAVLPLVAALLFATRQLSEQAQVELLRQTEEAARLVAEYHSARLELATERAALLADLPKLKAAVAEADAQTVEPIARDYRRRVRSDVFVVADRSGRTLVALGARSSAWEGRPDSLRFRVDGNRLLQAVGTPIRLDSETLGYLTLGFALDADFVSRLRALTGADVAIVYGGRVFASTLSESFARALPVDIPAQGVSSVSFGALDYLALPAALAPGDERAPVALVLRSRAETLRPLRTLRRALAVAALIAMGVVVLLSWAVARTVTRPLAALTGAMKQIAATGDLAQDVPSSRPWDDEDARLLSGTFGALTRSVARFQREAAIRDRLSALGRLSTVIAHEVRNPLMIIKGALRTLKQHGVSAGDLRDAAADVEREVARLDRIVADVLDFARPLRIEAAPVETATLVREAARAALDGHDSVRARFTLDPEAGTIVTDAERLRAVLVNLIANARDSIAPSASGAPGCPPDEIEIGARRIASGRLLLWIEDHGVGVAAADLPHVFEPYFTTKRTGTGLGLAIARKVVEGLGGSVHLESREAAGTRVEVELPTESPVAGGEAR